MRTPTTPFQYVSSFPVISKVSSVVGSSAFINFKPYVLLRFGHFHYKPRSIYLQIYHLFQNTLIPNFLFNSPLHSPSVPSQPVPTNSYSFLTYPLSCTIRLDVPTTLDFSHLVQLPRCNACSYYPTFQNYPNFGIPLNDLLTNGIRSQPRLDNSLSVCAISLLMAPSSLQFRTSGRSIRNGIPKMWLNRPPLHPRHPTYDTFHHLDVPSGPSNNHTSNICPPSSNSNTASAYSLHSHSTGDPTAAKSSASRSFPNLSRFINHRHRRASDVSHSQPITPCLSSRLQRFTPPSLVPTSNRTSLSLHPSRSRRLQSNPSRSFLSSSRSVSLDFIPRRRKPSNPHPPPSHPKPEPTDSFLSPVPPLSSPHPLPPVSTSPTTCEHPSGFSVIDPPPSSQVLRDTSPSALDSHLPTTTTSPMQLDLSSPIPPSSAQNTSEIDHNDLPTLSSTRHSLESSSANKPTEPLPHKRLMRRVGSSQNIRRLSLGHRAHVRNVRSTSFGDAPRSMWASGSLFVQRSSTDHASCRKSRLDLLRATSSDLKPTRWKRASCSCGDIFPIIDEQLVEIGSRLPDRPERMVAEDIFGRRRGDIITNNECKIQSAAQSVLAYQNEIGIDSERARQVQMQQQEKEKEKLKQLSAQKAANSVSPTPPDENPLGSNVRPFDTFANGSSSEIPSTEKHRFPAHSDAIREIRKLSGSDKAEEEETMRKIAKELERSKGRLRKSANMSKAFRAVIRSGDGFVRKSDMIQATLNNGESKDASMIILLEPDCMDSNAGSGFVEGVSSTSDESGSGDTTRSHGKSTILGNGTGFSTSMTAKQCAATLETILREMACKVMRHSDGIEDGQHMIRLRVWRGSGDNGRRVDRKVRVLVVIREEDRIRTSVSFRRMGGICVGRESHVPLCAEIRDRFQREWPAVVEALYIRLPSMTVSTNS